MPPRGQVLPRVECLPEVYSTMANGKRSGSTGRRKSGAYVYDDYRKNHVIWPGQASKLEDFIHQTYKGRHLKSKPAHSSHSEDALTWSCFDCLRQVKPEPRERALEELWELAYDGAPIPSGVRHGTIFVGKQYPNSTSPETEVDASIEGPGVLVFIEAKLYSTISQAELPAKPYNQLERKLLVGARDALASQRDFFFIVLDLAPPQILRKMNSGASINSARTSKAHGFASKWLTAYWFDRYKRARRGSTSSLRELLGRAPAVDGADPAQLARNLGWLTWADLFKIVLRAVVADRSGKILPPV